MPEMIRDGTGTGNLARVNDNNRLLTLSVIHTEEHIESLINAGAYFANSADTADTLTCPDGFDGAILCVSNNSETLDLVIQKIVVSANTGGGVVSIIRNHTVGAVTNNNVHIPVNSNFGSQNTAPVTAYNWDETGTTGIGGISGGTKWKTYSTPLGVDHHPVDGTIILTKNTSVSINFTNNTGGPIEFECGIRFYLDSFRED